MFIERVEMIVKESKPNQRRKYTVHMNVNGILLQLKKDENELIDFLGKEVVELINETNDYIEEMVEGTNEYM